MEDCARLCGGERRDVVWVVCAPKCPISGQTGQH